MVQIVLSLNYDNYKHSSNRYLSELHIFEIGSVEILYVILSNTI